MIEINLIPWQIDHGHRRVVAERLRITPEQYATFQRGVLLAVLIGAPHSTRCWITFDLLTVSGPGGREHVQVRARIHIADGRHMGTAHGMVRSWKMGKALSATRQIEGLSAEEAARLRCEVVWLPFKEEPRVA